MSEETKTEITDDNKGSRIEKLSNYITELLQSIKELGNDTPKEVLDAVEGAAIVIKGAKKKHDQNADELAKKKQADAEQKEIAERDALSEKVREIFEAAMDAELKTLNLFSTGAVSEDPLVGTIPEWCSLKYVAEKKVIRDINERILKNTPYTLCKYFRRASNAISYPFRGYTPTEVEGDGILIVRKDKVSEYENCGFDGEKLFELSKKQFEDMSIQDCINVAKYTGAPRNTETFVHLLDHLVRLGAWHVCTCKKAKKTKNIKVKKEDIIKAYKALIDRLNAFEAQAADMEIVD